MPSAPKLSLIIMGMKPRNIWKARSPKVTIAEIIWLEVSDDARHPTATKKVPIRKRMMNTPAISPPFSGAGVLERKVKALAWSRRGSHRKQ